MQPTTPNYQDNQDDQETHGHIEHMRLVLGDQLNGQHSWFQTPNPSVLYVLMEVRSETDYVAHHVQKVVAFFYAMRQFAQYLQGIGHRVHYISLDDPDNQQSFSGNILTLIQALQITTFGYQLPDEYRVDQTMQQLAIDLAAIQVAVQVFDSEHFMAERTTLANLTGNGKKYLMERFYRKMRTKHNLLMDPNGKDPLSGQWNYDADNRKKYDHKVLVPSWPNPIRTVAERAELIAIRQLLLAQNVDTIGQWAGDLDHPLTRAEALAWLTFFLHKCLPHFGTYEDAMDSQHQTLFHSRLSFALNIKLISPNEVVKAAIDAYTQSQTSSTPISLAQIEGFVRQIIGWREFMRGVYWAQMPSFANLNYFDHKAELPAWYWTGKTKLSCLAQAIQGSLNHAYAHHIQRLMVTGNFALLLGVDPAQVDGWYLGIYIDALEWVQLTNTRGMSQFADGGIIGSKPYVSSAAYIDKMSNYCSSCYYDKRKRHGERACPFNSLYWDFYSRHEQLLRKNPRVGMVYVTLGKFSADELAATLKQAAIYKAQIDTL